MSEQKQYYKLYEVAALFVVDERLIMREIRSRGLPFAVLGERIIRIPAETVQALHETGVAYYGQIRNQQ